MSIFEVIKTRRTTYQFLPKSVSKKDIDSFLEAAIWAPNHKLTQPWRFWVLGAQAQSKLAEVFSHHRGLKKGEVGTEDYQKGAEAGMARFSAIPKVILVGQVVSENDVVYKEDYAACSCAIQNFQLAAWEKQIGVQWSTGPIIFDDRTYELLGVDKNQIELIGALYIGYPECTGKPNRKPVSEVTHYLD